MAKLTPQEIREKHARNLKNATGQIQNAVMKVSTAPGVQAAKKQDKLVQNWTNAVTSGKWANRVSAVSLQQWQDDMVKKGIPRIAQGIDNSAAKVEAFFSEFMPFVDKVQSQVKAMPDLTLEDNLNRMVANARGLSQFRRNGRS